MLADLIQYIFGAVGALLLAGGGGALVAWWLIKTYAERWLNAKFEEQLQSRQHAQEREIERLRFRVNSMFDRKTKLHHREFEIIPDAWSKLVDAHGAVTSFTSFFQQYPDVDRMNSVQLDEFLANSKLLAWQKDQLKTETDKNKFYQKAIFYHRVSDCRNIYREAYVFVRKNGIFLPDELKEPFDKLLNMMWSALIEHEVNEEHDIHPREMTSRKSLDTTGKQLLEEIELMVRKRLWEEAEL